MNAQLTHQDDEIFLDREQIFPDEIMFGDGARHAERGVKFVHGAVSFDTEMRFRDPTAIHEGRRAAVTGSGYNAHNDQLSGETGVCQAEPI
jgi:hypothetical protein